jgi:RPA family protein
MEKKRLNSVKTRIKQITAGRYVAAEGMNPGYVLNPYGMRLSRVRISATVVDKFVAESGKFASLTLDDGTDTIRVKAFSSLSMFEKIGVGSEIDVIGKLKEYQGEVYVTPEIITQIEDPNFSLMRELEIRVQNRLLDSRRKVVLEHKAQTSDLGELQRIMKERFGIESEEVEAIVLSTNEEPNEPAGGAEKDKESLLKLIESLDQGSGCDYTELLKASGLPEDVVDSSVNELLEEGVCFEPRPGKIKKL